VSETDVNPKNLLMPIFVQEGDDIRKEIESMPGIFRLSPDKNLVKEVSEIQSLGIGGVLIFGIPMEKDNAGSEAFNENGVVQNAVRRIKATNPDVIVACDVCMCEYTSHGHCGILNHLGQVDNDKTIEVLAGISVSQAKAGADIVAPSAMMDNQVLAIRNALDSTGYSSTPIMSYSSKYASAFYGPFREAAGSTPNFGDRKSYQMDFSNVREALREVAIDVDQGADIIMVKPALSYLDVIRAVRSKFSLPLAAYSVSGEYSMIRAAAMNGWLSEERIINEVMCSIKRAGADVIITYFAKDYARMWRNSLKL
jgi:porphobilinogen synthase